MIITTKLLNELEACPAGMREFERECPNGLDLSLLWGSYADAGWAWGLLLTRFPKWIGWAWNFGVLPSIRVELRSCLAGADLSYADLTRANLTWADLTDVNLFHASLFCADINSARLSNANLCGADLTGVTLEAAKNLQGARYDESTEFPYGFDPKSFGMIDEGI